MQGLLSFTSTWQTKLLVKDDICNWLNFFPTRKSHLLKASINVFLHQGYNWLSLRMYWWVTGIFGHNWLLSVLFENCNLNCYQNLYSTTQFLKFKLEYLLWIGPFHTAKNQYPAAYRTATVMPNRSLFRIPISTSLTNNISSIISMYASVYNI